MGSFLTVGPVGLPFTGGVTVVFGGYVLLLAGCACVGAGLGLWRKLRRA